MKEMITCHDQQDEKRDPIETPQNLSGNSLYEIKLGNFIRNANVFNEKTSEMKSQNITSCAGEIDGAINGN